MPEVGQAQSGMVSVADRETQGAGPADSTRVHRLPDRSAQQGKHG